MNAMSDLPVDVVGEILSRVPMTSLRAVRSTCKKWNALSKYQIFGKGAASRKQFLGFMMMDYRVCSLRFDLHGIGKDDDFIDPSIKQVSILDQVEISQVFHCDGLLLCVTKDNAELVVWNPYLGQTRWIQPKNNFHSLDRYAIGYDCNGKHKILRIFSQHESRNRILGYEIYDFSSNSWKVFDVTPGWDIWSHQRGVSLKGNTYFLGREKNTVDGEKMKDILLCFDFTRERFGPSMLLPFCSGDADNVTLSCVREEQLAVLYQRWEACQVLEIWVTTKIDPNAVSWSSRFLRRVAGFPVDIDAGIFFIDEEKQVAVVFSLDVYNRTKPCRYQTAHIIGQDIYFKSVDIGEALRKADRFGNILDNYQLPLVSSSYVPSLVQLQINQPG